MKWKTRAEEAADRHLKEANYDDNKAVESFMAELLEDEEMLMQVVMVAIDTFEHERPDLAHDPDALAKYAYYRLDKKT